MRSPVQTAPYSYLTCVPHTKYCHTNQVGGKRSSFLPTLVFRPLTPPYVPFGIRQFLFWVPLEIQIRQAWITCLFQGFIGQGPRQYETICYAPIALTCISPLIGLILIYTTPYEVGYLCLGFLPRLPYAHSDSAT